MVLIVNNNTHRGRLSFFPPSQQGEWFVNLLLYSLFLHPPPFPQRGEQLVRWTLRICR